MSRNFAIKLSLFINYFVFAILLNSVGAVILQVQRNFDVSKADASILEGFKDIPIALISFFIASFLPKIGIKRGMMIALGVMSVMCFLMPNIANEFWYFKMLFVIIGLSFGIIKIGVYSIIGLVTANSKEHSSLMSWIEGFFMVGVLVGNVFISLFIDDANPKSTSWLSMYWYLGIMCLAALALLFFSRLDESKAHKEENNLAEDFMAMMKLILKPLVLVFVLSAFLFVLIEQSFQTWMPTFYENIIQVPASMSIQAGAVLAGAFAVGRILAGFVLQKVHWLPFTLVCITGLAICVIINIPMTKNLDIDPAHVNWFNAPMVVYLFPLMGLFLAPIYPTINSVILSALPKFLQSSMSGLIVVFSALGGTTGSIITGHVFEAFDGRTAFYMSLIPMSLLAMALIMLYRLYKNFKSSEYENA